jgi:hypothetical protein
MTPVHGRYTAVQSSTYRPWVAMYCHRSGGQPTAATELHTTTYWYVLKPVFPDDHLSHPQKPNTSPVLELSRKPCG